MGTSSNFGNMLSMALASLALPFLPLLPIQILLNNLLYDLSEVGIPFDRVDEKDVSKPQAWDMAGILRFTIVMGLLSSIFDLATFAILIKLFDAAPAEFRTAWFVESMATQILVIFFIRTSGRFYASNASRMLVTTSFGALVLALIIALTPIGLFFGFANLPTELIAAVIAITATYLLAAELAKNFATRFAHTYRS